MTNKRYTTGKRLREMIGWDQAEYIPEEARRLMSNWIILDEILDANSEEASFSDYSFVMAPMYKVLEVALWEIAKDLKLIKRGEQLGAFFNEDNLDTIFPKIQKKVKDKKKSREIKGNLHEIKNFLIRYRHNPAYAGFYFKTIDEERLAANSALHNIKCLVQDLLSLKILKCKPRSKQPTEVSIGPKEEEINIDEIPF